MSTRIVFHGQNAASFYEGFSDRLQHEAELICLPDTLDEAGRAAFARADIILGHRLDAEQPRPETVRLFQAVGAGVDAIDTSRLPDGAMLCNCHGHDIPITEYVMAALLNDCVPLAEADQRLRQGDWHYQSGRHLHGELHGRLLGILGFGHIGQSLAATARALGLRVRAANRSPVEAQAHGLEQAFGLDALESFYQGLDALVVALPETPATRGLVDAGALEALPEHVHVINVGRGGVIEEKALFDALSSRRIRRATIDTWYVYPSAEQDAPHPGHLPFQTLDNLVMTPHMSGWTQGTLERRKDAMADNVNRLLNGREPCNIVR